jgi:hypothetical protein
MNVGASPVPTSPVSHSGRSLVPTSQLDISHHDQAQLPRPIMHLGHGIVLTLTAAAAANFKFKLTPMMARNLNLSSESRLVTANSCASGMPVLCLPVTRTLRLTVTVPWSLSDPSHYTLGTRAVRPAGLRLRLSIRWYIGDGA